MATHTNDREAGAYGNDRPRPSHRTLDYGDDAEEHADDQRSNALHNPIVEEGVMRQSNESEIYRFGLTTRGALATMMAQWPKRYADAQKIAPWNIVALLHARGATSCEPLLYPKGYKAPVVEKTPLSWTTDLTWRDTGLDAIPGDHPTGDERTGTCDARLATCFELGDKIIGALHTAIMIHEERFDNSVAPLALIDASGNEILDEPPNRAAFKEMKITFDLPSTQFCEGPIYYTVQSHASTEPGDRGADFADGGRWESPDMMAGSLNGRPQMRNLRYRDAIPEELRDVERYPMFNLYVGNVAMHLIDNVMGLPAEPAAGGAGPHPHPDRVPMTLDQIRALLNRSCKVHYAPYNEARYDELQVPAPSEAWSREESYAETFPLFDTDNFPEGPDAPLLVMTPPVGNPVFDRMTPLEKYAAAREDLKNRRCTRLEDEA